jgi:hypothetical protein
VGVVVVVVVAVMSVIGGADLLPGTVRGRAAGIVSALLSLLPPPHADSETPRASMPTRTRSSLIGRRLTLDRGKAAAAVRAVVEVVWHELLERASAETQVLDRPGQVAGGGREGQEPAHDLELLSAVAVDVDRARLDLADDLAI